MITTKVKQKNSRESDSHKKEWIAKGTFIVKHNSEKVSILQHPAFEKFYFSHRTSLVISTWNNHLSIFFYLFCDITFPCCDMHTIPTEYVIQYSKVDSVISVVFTFVTNFYMIHVQSMYLCVFH